MVSAAYTNTVVVRRTINIDVEFVRMAATLVVAATDLCTALHIFFASKALVLAINIRIADLHTTKVVPWCRSGVVGWGSSDQSARVVAVRSSAASGAVVATTAAAGVAVAAGLVANTSRGLVAAVGAIITRVGSRERGREGGRIGCGEKGGGGSRIRSGEGGRVGSRIRSGVGSRIGSGVG